MGKWKMYAVKTQRIQVGMWKKRRNGGLLGEGAKQPRPECVPGRGWYCVPEETGYRPLAMAWASDAVPVSLTPRSAAMRSSMFICLRESAPPSRLRPAS